MPHILLMAYGSPYSETEIEPYYTDIRRGNPPPPELLQELIERYRTIGKSPLNEITAAQAKGLQNALGQGSRVWVGMKHWRPWIRDSVAAMTEAGVKKAVGIVAAPHYSHLSIGGYIERVETALDALGRPFEMSYVKHYHDHPRLIGALARRVQATLEKFAQPERVFTLFTAHSLPERILAMNDPYPEQLRQTAQLVSQQLGLELWDTAYQSAGRTAEPWLGPDIKEKLAELRAQGFKNVVVAAVGFPSDHLEVFYDIDHEAQNTAKELGMTLQRVPSLNADPDYIELLKALVHEVH
jgi:ferrochelatase